MIILRHIRKKQKEDYDSSIEILAESIAEDCGLDESDFGIYD